MGLGLFIQTLLVFSGTQAAALPIETIQSYFASVKDPISVDLSLETHKKECDSQECEDLVTYYQGLNLIETDREKSCRYFAQLSDHKSRAKFVSLLRQASNCTESKKTLEALTRFIDDKDSPQWIQFNASKAAAKLARKVAPEDFLEMASKVVERTRSKKNQNRMANSSAFI